MLVPELPRLNESELAAPVERLRGTRVFVLVNSRNAWWGTTSRRFHRRAVMFTLLRSAWLEAERRRKQGTTFLVREVPALRVDTAGRSVLMTDFQTDEPFRMWGRGRGEPGQARSRLRS